MGFKANICHFSYVFTVARVLLLFFVCKQCFGKRSRSEKGGEGKWYYIRGSIRGSLSQSRISPCRNTPAARRIHQKARQKPGFFHKPSKAKPCACFFIFHYYLLLPRPQRRFRLQMCVRCFVPAKAAISCRYAMRLFWPCCLKREFAAGSCAASKSRIFTTILSLSTAKIISRESFRLRRFCGKLCCGMNSVQHSISLWKTQRIIIFFPFTADSWQIRQSSISSSDTEKE